MNHEQTRQLLDAYLDGELDLVRSLEVERHLSECKNCSVIYQNRLAVRAALTDDRLYHRASSDLQKRIQRSVRPGLRLIVPRWATAAAALVIVALAVGAIWRNSFASNDNQLAADVLSSHVRSLMGNHLEDVVSTDQHTVKPWFDGKLPFSPPVIDLAAQGFPLVGGRLDYIDNHPCAALVYDRRKHIINLYIWPVSSGDTTAYGETSSQGYEMLHWTQDNMNFWAVSDVNNDDLLAFQKELQTQLAVPSPTQEVTS